MKAMKEEQIRTILDRGVSQIIKRSSLEKLLRSGKKLRVKLGIDPTAPDLHLGHAVVLRKLRQFQDAGHKAVLIIGDFTGQIGDPSGRSKTRPALSEAEVKRNMKSYLAQAGKVIDVKKAEIRKNSEWHKRGGLKSLLELARTVTVQQVLEREDFQKRMKAGENVSTLETLYPLLQGYDSVAVKADVELGGTDQLFNLLMGRRVQRHFGMKEQQVLTTPLLVGLDGAQKMSKSLGNYVGLTDNPSDAFGKLMSLPDSVMSAYFELGTNLGERDIKNALAAPNPRDAKKRLAFEIVKLYHGEKSASAAQENFERMFSKKEIQVADMLELDFRTEYKAHAFEIQNLGGVAAVYLVVKSKVCPSNAKAWELIRQGGFKHNGVKIREPKKILSLKNGDVLKIGKRHVFRVRLT
jgi:tyrosyl-tRNA synthetase